MIVRVRLFREEHDKFYSNYLNFQQAGPETLERRRQIAAALGQAWAHAWSSPTSTSTRMGRWDTWFFTEDALLPIGSCIRTELPVPLIGLLPGGSFSPESCVFVETRSATMVRRVNVPFVSALHVTQTGSLAQGGNTVWSAAMFLLSFLHVVNVSFADRRWEDVTHTFVSAELGSHNHRKTHTPYGQGSDIEP